MNYESENNDFEENIAKSNFSERYLELRKEFTLFKKLVDNLNPALDNIRQKISPIKSELKLTTDTMNMLNKLTINVASSIGNYLGNAIVGANLNNHIWSKLNPAGFLEKFFSNALTQGRAIGGNIAGGQPYLVGEKGPELFTPSNSGMITPNNRLTGKQAINIMVNLNTNSNNYFNKTTNQNLRDLSRAIYKVNKNF